MQRSMVSAKKRRMAVDVPVVLTMSPYECVFDTTPTESIDSTPGRRIEDESDDLKPKSLAFGDVPVVSALQSQYYVQPTLSPTLTATRATPLKRRFVEPVEVVDDDDDDTGPRATPLKKHFAVPFEDWCSTVPCDKSPVMASRSDGADPQRMVAAIASPMRNRRSLHRTSSSQNGPARDWCTPLLCDKASVKASRSALSDPQRMVASIASPMRSRRFSHNTSSYHKNISQDVFAYLDDVVIEQTPNTDWAKESERSGIQPCIPTMPEIENQTRRLNDGECLSDSERLSDSDVTSEATDADLTEGPSDDEETFRRPVRQSSVRPMRSEKCFNSPVVISDISEPELETPTEQRSDISSLDETPTEQKSVSSSLDVDENVGAPSSSHSRESPAAGLLKADAFAIQGRSPADLVRTVAVTQAIPAVQVAIQGRAPAELVRTVAVTQAVPAPQVGTQRGRAAPSVKANDVPQSAQALQEPQKVPAMSSLAARVAAIRQALRQSQR